nr:MAG TPA: hypothetical protein [Caudoviricetes sp.]DAO10560.1 MAG TPA: hypothetical protein [Bacteriophage sp.]
MIYGKYYYKLILSYLILCFSWKISFYTVLFCKKS